MTRRGRARSVLGVVLAGLAAGGCIADASGERAVSTTAVTTPDTAPPDFVDLEAVLPDTPPDGYEKAPDAVADTGAVDGERAVLHDGAGDAQQFFLTQQFVKGYQRRFVDGSARRHVDIWVYEFAQPSGASAWLLRTMTQASTGGEAFDASSIANASGATRTLPDGTVAVVAYPAGNRVVRVEAQDPDAATARTNALAAARAMTGAVPPS